MSIGNGAPAWPSVIVSNGGISPSDHMRGTLADTVRGARTGKGYGGELTRRHLDGRQHPGWCVRVMTVVDGGRYASGVSPPFF